MNKIKVDKEAILFYADAFVDKDEARDFLDDRISYLESFDQDFELVRLVFLESPSDLNIMNLGNHWVYDEDILDDISDYLKNECSGEVIAGKSYLIRAKFRFSDINIETTLTQNVLNPEEEELYIDDNVKPAGLATIEPYMDASPSVSLREFIGTTGKDLEYEY